MSETRKPILEVLKNEEPKQVPVWLMRQAGRYLLEYRALRAKAGGFLDLCLTPEWATEITLQPIRRFGFDAAILFADILLVPYALGQKLEFREGEGPVLEAVKPDDLSKLVYDQTKVSPVFETVKQVKTGLPAETALIGFCGGLWTVACYMIGGNSRNGFIEAKSWAARKPDSLQKLMDILLDASELYLSAQIEAGAEVLQIFDSWAGLHEGKAFGTWVIEPTKKLVTRLKKKYPHVPIIGFPREAEAGDYSAYIRETGVDAVSIDQRISLDFAEKELQPVKPLQGNLDPAFLVKGGEDMRDGIKRILDTLGPKHIFNLGHGVTPDVPPEHVAELVECVRKWRIS